jgi:hypothetical protein
MRGVAQALKGTAQGTNLEAAARKGLKKEVKNV